MSIGAGIVRQVVPAVLTTVYTSPATPGSKTDVRSITIVNRDENNVGKIWLYIVPVGDTAGNGNILIPDTKQWEVPKGRNIDYETWKVLGPNDTIQVKGIGSLTLHIDGAFVV